MWGSQERTERSGQGKGKMGQGGGERDAGLKEVAALPSHAQIERPTGRSQKRGREEKKKAAEASLRGGGGGRKEPACNKGKFFNA